ncbi:hypothetical protein D3C76_765810 [compost metagenome]
MTMPIVNTVTAVLLWSKADNRLLAIIPLIGVEVALFRLVVNRGPASLDNAVSISFMPARKITRPYMIGNSKSLNIGHTPLDEGCTPIYECIAWDMYKNIFRKTGS